MDSSDKIMFFSDEDNQNLKLHMEIDCDPSLYYRGVIINNLEILTLPNGECQYGDINHDGIINIIENLTVSLEMIQHLKTFGNYNKEVKTLMKNCSNTIENLINNNDIYYNSEDIYRVALLLYQLEDYNNYINKNIYLVFI